MSKEYFLSDNGTHSGPFTFEQVLEKIDSRAKQWTDYVYDFDVGDWRMLLEHPEFAEKLISKVPERPKVKPSDNTTVTKTKTVTHREAHAEKLKDKEWFIMKGDNKYGPFCYLDLVQMLQRKSLSEFDFVWHSKLTTWKTVAEVEDFAPEKIRNLKDLPENEISEIFFRRRHQRANYAASLIVHNNKTVFRGKALEIGAGGAGILIDNPTLKPGQSLFLHFQPGDGVPPFNAVCEIVNKKTILDGVPAVEKTRYGVKFTAVTQAVRDSITNFISDKVA